MFTRIAHVCLNTSNLERSVAWYEKLGFRILFRGRKGEAQPSQGPEADH